MNFLDMHEYVKRNILTTSEVTEMLQITKTRVSRLVEEGKLIPAKKTPNGMLFIRNDINNYIKNNKNSSIGSSIKKANVLYEDGYNTRKSLDYFKEHRHELGEIISIFVYFNDLDAAIANFYTVSESIYSKWDNMTGIETAHLVLRDSNGKEMWLTGCNCGYIGTGPRGTTQLLKSLRAEGTLPAEMFTDNYLEELTLNRKIMLLKETNLKWDVNVSDSRFSTNPTSTASLYLYNNRLVLIQDIENMWEKDSTNVLMNYSAFIQDPSEILIFSDNETAAENGYVGYDHSGRIIIYNIIIYDTTGRQIWLSETIDNKLKLMRQPQIANILRQCGLDVENLNKTEDKGLIKRIMNWANSELRTVAVEPLHIKFNDEE